MYKIILVFALFLTACSGGSFSAENPGSEAALEAGTGGAVVTASGGSGGVENPGSQAKGGSVPMEAGSQGGTAGQQTAGTGGAPQAGAAGMLASVAGMSSGGSAGVASQGGSSGTQTIPIAGSAGVQGCIPKLGDAACGQNTCGDADDGCGGRVKCGTVCGVLRQYDPQTQTTKLFQEECVATNGVNSCQVTCSGAGVECGDVPQFGLSCGGCTAKPDGACGVLSPGLCSYCARNGTGFASACGSSTAVLWSICGSLPAAGCWLAKGPAGENLKGQYCCPA